MPLRDPMADYCPVEKSFTKVKYNRPLIVHVLIGYPPSKKLDGSLRQKKTQKTLNMGANKPGKIQTRNQSNRTCVRNIVTARDLGKQDDMRTERPIRKRRCRRSFSAAGVSTNPS